MKKMFVLFFLVALMPFTVGCGLFGDNDDTSPIAAGTLTLSRLFPAESFSGSLRGATTISLNYSDLFMNVTVSGSKIKLNYKKHTNKAAGVEVEFAAQVLPSVIETIKGTAVTIEVQIQPAGVTEPAVVVAPTQMSIPSSLTSGTTSTVLDSSPVTPRTDTEIMNEIRSENPSLADAAQAPDYTVTKVMFGSTEVSKDSLSPTMVTKTDGKYVFTVTLNQPYTNSAAAPTFAVEVANIKGTSKVITGSPYVTVTWNQAKTEATITVTPSATDSNYQLTAGETYSVTLVSTDAVSNNSKATLPRPYYIYTNDNPTGMLTLSRLFPTGSFNGSLRGATTIALHYSDLFMYVTVSGSKIKLNYKKHINKAAGVEVEFAAPVLPSVIEQVKGNTVSVEVQIQPAGVTQPAVVVPATNITVPSTLTSGTTATVLESTPITTVKTDAEILTEIKTENPTISDPVIAEDYKVTSVMFGTYTVSQTAASPTPISAVDGKYTFTVYFNQAYTNTAAPTFSIEVANATTKILTGNPLAVTWSTDKKSATVVVTTDATYKLTTGQDYTVTLKSTDAIGTNGVKATLPGTFYVLAR